MPEVEHHANNDVDSAHPAGFYRTVSDLVTEPLRHTGTVVCVAMAHLAYQPCTEILEMKFGLSHAHAGFVLTQSMGIVTYWFWAVVFYFLDSMVSTGGYPFLNRFKLRSNASEPSFSSLAPACAFNQAQTVVCAWLGFTFLFTVKMVFVPLVPLWSSYVWSTLHL
jgi:hypothetical protein